MAYELYHQRIGLNLKIGGIGGQQYRRFARESPKELKRLTEELRRQGGFSLNLGTTPYSEAGVYWVNIGGMAGPDDTGSAGGDIHDYFHGRLSAINVEHLTYAEVKLKKRIFDSLKFYRERIPGFENVQLLAFASQLGVRESRLISGLYRLTWEDIAASRDFSDAVGMVGIAAKDTPGRFQVPYHSLLPVGVEGLLVAGRCISTDH